MSKRKLVVGIMAVLLFLVLVVAFLTWMPTSTLFRKYHQPIYTAQQLNDNPLPLPGAIGELTAEFEQVDIETAVLCVEIINEFLWEQSGEDGYDAVYDSIGITIDGKKISPGDVSVSQQGPATFGEVGESYGGNIIACTSASNLETGFRAATVRFESDGTEYTHEWAFEVTD